MEQDSAVKEQTPETHTSTLSLRCITLSERSQSQKLHAVCRHLCDTVEKAKLQGQGQSGVARGHGGSGVRAWLQTGSSRERVGVLELLSALWVGGSYKNLRVCEYS